MKIEVGTVIESSYTTGPVVAITKEWVIQKDIETGNEFALARNFGQYSTKVTEHVIGGGGQDDGMPKAGQWWVRKERVPELQPIYIVGYGADGRLVYQPEPDHIWSMRSDHLAEQYRHDPDCNGWEDDET